VIGPHPMLNTATLPVTGMPRVEFIEHNLARWTFATSDRTIQAREFEYWRGWFGFDETDEPDEVGGDVWFVRQQAGPGPGYGP
jgi:hypothetical protein